MVLATEIILDKVKEVLSESLDIEASDINLEDLMFANYNIESTEILEITFRIEEEFEFEMNEDEFWNIPSLIANNHQYGTIHSESSFELINKYFEIPKDILKELKSPFDLYDYIRVKDLVNYIQDKLGE